MGTKYIINNEKQTKNDISFLVKRKYEKSHEIQKIYFLKEAILAHK